VGHKTRTALGRKCRKQPKGAAADGSAELPPSNGYKGAPAPPAPGQGLAPPGGPKGKASYFGGGAAAPTPTPYAGAASAEAPPRYRRSSCHESS
jgi:hypothetical protein